MEAHTNLERNWRQFPLLAKTITERSKIPDHLYRAEFSYFTHLDDFHDWMLMVSQVAEPDSLQLDTSNIESPQNIRELRHGLHREFAELQSRIELITQFLANLRVNLHETEQRVHQAFELWIKDSEQDGAGQPATRPVVEPEGGDNPQSEVEGRSR
jgi:hypothetical protein